MKVNASILMYSGMQNPERELSELEVIHILYLLSKVDQHYKGEYYPKLGFLGYAVRWQYDENEKEPIWENPTAEDYPPLYFSVYTHIKTISIYKNSLMSGPSMYHDTVGMEEYLKEILEPLLQDHLSQYKI